MRFIAISTVNNYVINMCPRQLLWFIEISLVPSRYTTSFQRRVSIGVCTNQLTWKRSQYDWNASFEKCCYFLQTILSFLLSRKIRKIYNDIAQKHGNATVKNFQKYEKFKYHQNKFKLGIDFFNNCKQLGVYPKFLIFKLPNVSNKDALSILKRLLCSATNKRNIEVQHLLLTSTSSTDL